MATTKTRTLCFLLAVLALCAASGAAAAERSERSTILILGNEAGFQEAVYGDDGSVRVHFEYNDRGRGPKTDSTFRVGADGTYDAAEIKGVAYFKTPVDETFARDAKQTRWKNTSEDERREGRVPGLYSSLNGPPEEVVLMARALLAAPQQKLPLIPVGELRIERVAELRAKGEGSAQVDAVLYAIHGFDLTPSYPCGSTRTAASSRATRTGSRRCAAASRDRSPRSARSRASSSVRT